MTFKTVLPLSVIVLFVIGSFVLAGETPETTSTATSTVIPQTDDSTTTTESTSWGQPGPVYQDSYNGSSQSSRGFSSGAAGYSVQQIRNMPMVARPNRPGHFIGNTVRAFYRGRRGR